MKRSSRKASRTKVENRLRSSSTMEPPTGSSSFTKYSSFVLFLLMLAYFVNQLDRYILPITTKEMAQELHYGDFACMENSSIELPSSFSCNETVEDKCEDLHHGNDSSVCVWDRNGQGYEYQLLAGPLFIVVYTLTGIPLGFAADVYNRKVILVVCLIFWSVMTTLSGAVKSFWQISILRFLVGMGEAGCTPFATSIIADYFDGSVRGVALGIYNLGIYLGYSLAYAFGNGITEANIYGQGWRWAYYLAGIPGVVLGVVVLLGVREPRRTREASVVDRGVLMDRLKVTIKALLRPSLLMLFLAGSIRNAGGYVIAINTQNYMNSMNIPKSEVSKYMSWIPLVGGSMGVILGGFISDLIVKRRGPHARIIVLVVSQLLALPFTAGFLYFDVPGAFFSLIGANIFGEMWVGVCLAVVVELVPAEVRTSAVAVYLFVITNIGGNIPLAVTPLKKRFLAAGYSQPDSLRGALYILYPGCFLGGSFLFLLTLIVLKRDLEAVKRRAGYTALLSPQDVNDGGEARRDDSYGSTEDDYGSNVFAPPPNSGKDQ